MIGEKAESMKSKINIHLQGLNKVQQVGTKELEKELEFEQSDAGFPVVVQKNENGLKICISGGQAVLSYHKEVEFYRGLGILVQQLIELKNPEERRSVEEHAFF